MSNSPKEDHKLSALGKLVLGMLIVFGVTLLCISWNALAGPKQEPIKENSAASASVPGGKHKAEKKKVSKQRRKSERSSICHLMTVRILRLQIKS